MRLPLCTCLSVMAPGMEADRSRVALNPTRPCSLIGARRFLDGDTACIAFQCAMPR